MKSQFNSSIQFVHLVSCDCVFCREYLGKQIEQTSAAATGGIEKKVIGGLPQVPSRPGLKTG